MINEQKRYAYKIKIFIGILNIIGVLIASGVFAIALIDTVKGNITFLMFSVILMLSLVFVVYHMRRTI